MRLATWNIQWFDHLFDERSRLHDDGGRGGREGVTRHEQTQAIAHVLRAIDADAVMVIEAPDARRRTRDGQTAPVSPAAIAAPTGFYGVDGAFRFQNGVIERALAVNEVGPRGLRVLEAAPAGFGGAPAAGAGRPVSR